MKVLVFKEFLNFVMKSLFSNKGPFDINFIISKHHLVAKKKIINISNLVVQTKMKLLLIILNILMI